jgi:hypothetical protein
MWLRARRPPQEEKAAPGERSRRPRRNVEDDGRRSCVKQPLDEFYELVRILKSRIRIEASDLEELPVALHAPIYPPRPHVLALPPASDLHSRQGPSLPCEQNLDMRGRSIILPERLNIESCGPGSVRPPGEHGGSARSEPPHADAQLRRGGRRSFRSPTAGPLTHRWVDSTPAPLRSPNACLGASWFSRRASRCS